MSGCPDESEILELVEGRVQGAAVETMRAHLDDCAACRELVANAADGLSIGNTSQTGRPGPIDDAHRLRGSMIGRFTVLSREGAGGMGAVYSAYDPQLDRRIAVKLVRTDRLMRGDQSAVRAQVLREAQAMARLNHPNVIAVYDVGTVEDELFIAMEYVEGATLGAWSRRAGRSWHEILAYYLRAGEGLAAAHRAGLVHRDFKPDNVLVGDDGRLRVGDFGLARIRAIDEVGSGSAPAATPGASTSPAIGTPAYMAPEQRDGVRVDARADQFSFCRALEQALFEEAGTGAPAWLRAPLVRGQEADREFRFPDMHALLASLRRDPDRTRRRALAAAGVACLATIAVFSAAYSLHADEQGPCVASIDALAGVWDEPVRERVTAALRGSERPDAGEVTKRVDATLSSYASGWTAMHTEVCEATRVRAEQSETLFDVRMQCLARLRGRLGALTELLAEQRPPPIDEAIPAASSLPSVDECADTERLLAVVPLPDDPEARAAILAAHEKLDRLRVANYFAGDTKAVLPATRELLAEARALAHPPLEQRVLGLLADQQGTLGDHAGTEATLNEALRAAAAAHDDRAFGTDMIRLVAVLGVGQNRFAEAELAARITESVLLRADSPDEDLAGLYSARGQLARAQAKLYEARAFQERSIELIDAAPGATLAARASERSNLGATLTELGDHTGALAQLEQARAIFEDELGATHPVIATVLLNIGSAHVQQGALEQGMAAYRAAVEIWERAYGEDHLLLGKGLGTLAAAEHLAGQDELARRDMERSIAILERTVGADHVELAWARGNYGAILCASGEYGAAIAQLELALAIAESALGPDHPDNSYALSGLAECHLDHHAVAKAIPLLERTLGLLASGEGDLTRHRIEETRALLESARALAR